MSTPPPSTEDRLLDWLREHPAAWGGLGDDAALLPSGAHQTGGGRLAVTVDQQIEAVHFPSGTDPAIVARRLVAVNLSDLAAVGARPAWAFSTVAAPADFDHRRFFRSLCDAAERHDFSLAGGDLATTAEIRLTLTLIGRRPAGNHWLQRHLARPGDSLWVGGSLGEAAVGLALTKLGAGIEGRKTRLPAKLALPPAVGTAARRAVRRYLCPSPQLELGLRLGRRRRVAAIDLSDGLTLDLARLCRASGVGAAIDADRLPLPRLAPQLAAAVGLDAMQAALEGGDDYVLLFTLPPGSAGPPNGLTAHRIGTVRTEGLTIERDGERVHLEPGGWDHLARG